MTLDIARRMTLVGLLGGLYLACSDDQSRNGGTSGGTSGGASGRAGGGGATTGAAGSQSGRSGAEAGSTGRSGGLSGAQSGARSGSAGAAGRAGSAGDGGTASGKAGAGGSGGSSTGASDAGGSSGATSGSGCGKARLCDDFESAASGGPPDPAKWSIFTTPNVPGPERSITVDDSVAHSGSHSVLSDGQGGAARFFGVTSLPENIGDTVFVRVWIRFSRALAVGHAQYVVLNSNGDFNTGKELRLAGQEQLMKWTDIPSDHSLPNVWVAKDKSIAPTPGDWYCFEFGVDTVNSKISFWINDQPWPGLEYTGEEVAGVTDQFYPWTAFAFTHIGFGWRGFGDGDPMKVWYDDIAIGSEHLGCN